jgi:hypothetical protein
LRRPPRPPRCRARVAPAPRRHAVPAFQPVSPHDHPPERRRRADRGENRGKVEAVELGRDLLAKVGLAEKADVFPAKLSGGGNAWRSPGHSP